MRRLVAALAVVLACSAAFGMNWKVVTRVMHKTLDVVMRRLDYAISVCEDDLVREELETIRRHLAPVYARFGGPISWFEGRRIRIGSQEEEELINKQHGYAGSAEEKTDRRRDLKVGLFRWLKELVVSVFYAFGPWVFMIALAGLAAFFWVRTRQRDNEDVQLRRKLDELFPDKEQRKALFCSDLIARAHQRLKRKGKL